MTPEEDLPRTAVDDAEDAKAEELSDATEAAGATETSAVDADAAESTEDAAPSTDDDADASTADVDPRVDEVLGGVSIDEGEGVADPAAATDDANAEPGDGEDLAAKLAAAEARANENWDRLLRMQADVENKNKRAQRDVQNARKFALETIAADLLPIKDSLEMGLAAASEDAASVDSIREGSELTLKMLGGALEKHNIVEINPEGEKFDPEFHQAMSMQPAPEGTEPNTVISVMQKGYTLNDRLIRPALVMVAK